MNLHELLPAFTALRSLGFGACLGVGSALLLYAGGVFPSQATPETLATAGGLLGLGLHQLVDTVLVRGILRPIGSFVKFYGELVEATVLGSVLPARERRDLIRRKIRDRIEGSRASRNRSGSQRMGDLGEQVVREHTEDTAGVGRG